MAVAISEEWIRQRVQLKHSNLEDVRSLSLPGTYHEKIGELGAALRGFTRLKHLDLSRNALDSLEGLEYLKMLEKLNLYYNNVPSLQELYRLRHNEKLEDLDLRLNPVARNEPDYRLFLIHMLPNLRRLDDRAVRDSERKAALLHFSTDQAAQLTMHRPLPETSRAREPLARTEHVQSLRKPAHALDDDDVAVLDLMAEAPHVVSRNHVTGSVNTKPAVQTYPPESLRRMNLDGVGLASSSTSGPSSRAPSGQNTKPLEIQTNQDSTKETLSSVGAPSSQLQGLQLSPHTLEMLASKYPNLPLIKFTPPSPNDAAKHPVMMTASHEAPAWPLSGLTGEDVAKTKNDYAEEVDAYTAFKAKGNFTAHPEAGAIDTDKRHSHARFQDATVNRTNAELPARQNHFVSFSVSDAHNGEQSAAGHSESISVAFPTENPPIDMLSAVAGRPGDARYQLYVGEADNQQLAGKDNHVHGLHAHTVEQNLLQHSSFALARPAPNTPEPCLPRTWKDTVDTHASGQNSDAVHKISDLVDKYWNGSKSLIGNVKFRGLVDSLVRESSGDASKMKSASIDELEIKIAQLEEELKQARRENNDVKDRVMPSDTDGLPSELQGTDMAKAKSSLVRATRDVNILRSRLQRSMEENKCLAERLADLESTNRNMPDTNLHGRIESLERENEQLRRDVATLAAGLQRSSQEADYARMLHHSHRALMENNQHLTTA